MKLVCVGLGSLALCAAALGGAADEAQSPSEKTKAAPYVFVGTVTALKDSNLKEVQKSENTILVKVERVLKPAEGAGALVNQTVTLLLAQAPPEGKLKAGQRATFYADAYAFGENTALEEVAPPDVIAAGGAGAKGLHALVGPTVALVQDSSDEALKAHLEQAKTVVYGKVKAVRRVSAKALAGGVGAAPKVKRRPVSEHSADWHVADVQVLSVEKGPANQKTVQVYFANSKDVAYRDVPKFHPEQEGTFLLHTQQPGSAPVHHLIMAAEADNQPPAYTALNPLDFQPKVPNSENLARIRRLLGKK